MIHFIIICNYYYFCLFLKINSFFLIYSQKYSIFLMKSFLCLFVFLINYMFCNCNHLINVDLSSFQVDIMRDMTRMFYNCNNLKEIDLSSFETDNVTSMYSMFNQCVNLIDINLSSFNTSKAEHFNRMFNGYKKIKTLDLLSFDSNNVINVSSMLNDCKNLKIVKINSDLFEKIKKEVNTNKIEFIVREHAYAIILLVLTANLLSLFSCIHR